MTVYQFVIQIPDTVARALRQSGLDGYILAESIRRAVAANTSGPFESQAHTRRLTRVLRRRLPSGLLPAVIAYWSDMPVIHITILLDSFQRSPDLVYH